MWVRSLPSSKMPLQEGVAVRAGAGVSEQSELRLGCRLEGGLEGLSGPLRIQSWKRMEGVRRRAALQAVSGLLTKRSEVDGGPRGASQHIIASKRCCQHARRAAATKRCDCAELQWCYLWLTCHKTQQNTSCKFSAAKCHIRTLLHKHLPLVHLLICGHNI